jgi:hypothetical protein
VHKIPAYFAYSFADLESVTIPESVISVGKRAFQGCWSLMTINFNAISCEDFFVGYYDHPFLNLGIQTINIGNYVERIPASLAYGLTELTNITIPNSVTVIGSSAFSGCVGLANVTIGNSVTTIEASSFSGCSSLPSIIIPNSVTIIEQGVFAYCSGLEYINVANGNSIYDSRYNCNAIIETSSNTLITGCKNSDIPNSVISIGNCAFSGCSGMTSIAIPNSVTSIGYNAFAGCTGLTSISIPSTINVIGNNAFVGCSSLDSLNFNAISCIDFSLEGPPFNNLNISTINIGENVQKIPCYFAQGLTKLVSISFPGSINSIGSSAFYNCEGLDSVITAVADPSLISMGEDVFKLDDMNYSDRVLHVPNGSVGAYQANAKWRPYFGAIIDDSVSIPLTIFEIDAIQYTVSSDSTVTVSGQSYLNGFDDNEYEYYESDIEINVNIVIPSQVSYDSKEYTVTEIGDWSFYCESQGNVGDHYHDIVVDYDITIPETITSIGYKAFGGGFSMANVFCEAKTPPVMDEIVDESHGFINLFVSADAYVSYQELNNQNHYFDAVYITDGEQSGPPKYSEELLEQPVGCGPYGCAVKIFPSENSVVYMRHISNGTGLYDHIYIGGWTKCNNLDSIYYYYETECDGGARPDGWAIEFFAINEGHSPSAIICCGLLGAGGEKGRYGIDYKRWEYFDFKDKGICYNVYDNCASVTYQGYDGPCVGEKGSADSIESIAGTNKPKDSVKTDHYEDEYDYVYEFVYYSGDVVIPNMAIYRNYDEDTYTAYPVTSINWRAFMDCEDLQSVTLPENIVLVQEETFINCPNLSFIKCLGTTPASASESSFDDGVYQNTILYVPRSAIGAYRQAEGWCNFLNIVGVNDDNFLSMGNVEAFRGDTIVIPVALTNEASIISFQTDIFLPDGIELLQEDGEYIIDPSDRMTHTHSIVSSDVSNGAVRVLCYSSNYKPFTGESGDDLFFLTVKVADDAEGDYAIQLKNTLLTTSDFEELVAPDCFGNVHVKTYLPGDANGSGTVTVTDVVVTSQYVLEQNPHPFIFEAADVNADGTITVTDVSRIAWMVLNPTLGAPMRASTLWNSGDLMSGESVTLLPGETRKVSIALDNEMDYTAFQLDLNLPDGLSARNFAVTDRAGSHAFDVNLLADGNMRALCYSPTLQGISGHEGALLTFDVTAMSLVQGDITVDGIELVTVDCQTVKLDGFAIGVNNSSAINEVANGKTVARVDYFNLAGQQLTEPVDGVTIMITTYTDGTRIATKIYR